MNKIVLHDAMSVLRAELERDHTGFAVRGVVARQFEEPGLHIWVWDGPRNSASRKAIYPGYKANREPAPVPIMKGLELIRSMLELTPAIQVREPDVEADDVIAELVRQYHRDNEIEIRTRDRDLLALTIYPNVTATVEPYPNVETRWIHLYKATVGDPSDEVKGIYRFGNKAWEQADKKHLLSCVSSHGPRLVSSWLEAGLSKTSAEWAAENYDTIRACWKITGFLPLTKPMEPIVGIPNRNAALSICKEYMI